MAGKKKSNLKPYGVKIVRADLTEGEAALTMSDSRKSLPCKTLAIKPIQAILRVGMLLTLPGLWGLPATAQIVPDASLPNPSTVIPNGNIEVIEGGTAAGSSLFHSFQEFSVPTGGEAFFNNALDVINIITRVTGSNISDIDGLIRANGTANLLLINPNGLRFGPNARLNIGGSFLGSSADSIRLSDETLYSAVDPQAPPLLTVNVPLGLQLRANPGAIRVEGNGHGFTIRSIRTTPVNRSEAAEGLQVRSGNTLALVGGDVNLVGGVLRAEEGQVALGGASGGEVSLASTELGWTLGYEGVQSFRDINLSGQAAIDASGLGMGSIQIAGRDVRLTDGSAGLIQNEGSQPAGELKLNASESLEVTGTNSEATFPSLLFNETLGDGLGGKTNIFTRKLLLSAGGIIHNKTYGNANGGNVFVRASEAIEVSAFASSNPGIFSSLVAVTVGEGKAGNAGNLIIEAQKLTVLDGGVISTSTLNAGQGGDITINALGSVIVSGVIPERSASAAVSSSAGDRGNAGTVTINTSRLAARDGGTVITSTLAEGSAGNLIINASNSVEVSGKGQGGGLPSRIQSDGVIFPEVLRQALGLPDRPSGDSGELTINTPQLIVSDTAQISVGNEGTGLAGDIQLNAGSILLLDTEGGITAATASGEGGNMAITTDFLQLRRNSQISTEAGGTGNGGNINIDARNIVALENSDINANAFEGRGGRVSITARGIFGTEFRQVQTPQSDITATSALGPQFGGIVEINTPDTDPASGLVVLPANTIDPNQKIFSGCDATEGSSFTVTGRGGLPEDPTARLRGRALWWDGRDALEIGNKASLPPQSQTPQSRTETEPVLQEATGWIVNADGEVELVVTTPNTRAWNVGCGEAIGQQG